MTMREIDRRTTGDDRRSKKRYPITLEVEWESHYGRRNGTLSDISEDGCFVLSEVDVSDGELVRLYIPLSDGMKVEFLGQVANFVAEIGFAVNFLSMSDAQKEFINSFVEVYKEEKPEA